MAGIDGSGRVRAVGLVLTFFTGFSGLVYEVAWQKYLAALLGSDSAATASVLGLFLGGLAGGYALFGRVARELAQREPPGRLPARLLLVYGAVEIGIGVYALCFPWLFAGVRAVSLWLPAASSGAAFATDVLLSALLIVPPTLLMGGTIPLLTQALARSLAESTRLHSFVYGFNTAGAFAGALSAGFVLVPWLGLAGVMLSMACVNLAAGGIFAALGARGGEPDGADAVRDGSAGAAEPPSAARSGEGAPAPLALYAGVALLSGFAMMALQTTLNRVGALALGASQFTFSMVVAAFVLCIALGSFGVSALRRIPPALLPGSQWLLVGILLALYPAVADAPYWAHRLRAGFENQPASFYPFQLAVFGALLALLLAPLALSGATLPLLFHQVRRERGGLGSAAGRLYSWNTVGSLLGALLGGYALLFWLDLHQVYWLAATALALGAAALSARVSPRGRALGGAGLALALLVIGLQSPWSPYKLSAGLFRFRTELPYVRQGPAVFLEAYRNLRGGDYIAYYNDDPAASIAVFQYADSSGVPVTAIINNGKSDGNVPGDYVTMSMAALLPALLAERAERAFVIGYGTGVTVSELAELDTIRQIDVAEISPGVMEAAPWFDCYEGAAAHPKTRVIVGDAYRALLRSTSRYDLISSEPSNPWVTGVEMLFSRDFLQAAQARLAPGGVYLQWFHTYETDSETIGVVLKTFADVFAQVAVWYSQRGDLLVLGFPESERELDLARLEARWSRPDYRAGFDRIHIDSLPELLAHELLPLQVVHRADLPYAVHTLAHPILSHRAARAFFAADGGAAVPVRLTEEVRRAGASNSLLARYRASRGDALSDGERIQVLSETCAYRPALCATLFAHWTHEDPDSPALAQALETARRLRVGSALRPELLAALASLYESESPPPADLDRATLRALYERAYHHAAPFARDP